MYANPVLAAMPRLSLPTGEPSGYRVRRAREPAAVSTIEAIVRTLTVLEPEHDFQPVLKPFEVLIDQQIQAMGASQQFASEQVKQNHQLPFSFEYSGGSHRSEGYFPGTASPRASSQGG